MPEKPEKRASWLPVILCLLAFAGVLYIIHATQERAKTTQAFSDDFEQQIQSAQTPVTTTPLAPLDTSGLTELPADDWVDVPSEAPAGAQAAQTTTAPAQKSAWDRIEIQASQDAWMLVSGPNGRALFNRVMNPGETYLVPEEPGLTLDTGNAGGITITVNGNPQPALGAAGQVKRKIPLRPKLVDLSEFGDPVKADAAPEPPKGIVKLPPGAVLAQQVEPGIIMAASKAKRIAPFRIKTAAGANYYVKLVDSRSDAAVLGIYVKGGQPLDVDVPLGSYRMRYASGETWFGLERLFGPKTAYAKADDVFEFKLEGSQVSGYTVELILQPNGNLDTRQIPASEF